MRRTIVLLSLTPAVVRQPRSAVLAFLAGLAVLRVLALVPFMGGLVWFGDNLGTGSLDALELPPARPGSRS